MTQREFFMAVTEGTITEEMQAFAQEAIEKLNARNAKRAERPSKNALANEPIKAEIAKVLTSEPQTASAIASAVGISVQKASALLRQMDCEVTEIKVPKKGTQKAYFIA